MKVSHKLSYYIETSQTRIYDKEISAFIHSFVSHYIMHSPVYLDLLS